jgi:hypothetical protein
VQRLHLGALGHAEVVVEPPAEFVVHAERLGRASLLCERLHEQPVAALAVRLEPGEPSRGAHRGGQPGAADSQAGAGVGLERAQMDTRPRQPRSVGPACSVPPVRSSRSRSPLSPFPPPTPARSVAGFGSTRASSTVSVVRPLP